MNINEKKLTPNELKKREEIAKAIERDNPSMPMGKKMAIATATAKKVTESETEVKMKKDFISFKDFRQIYEEQVQEIDRQITEMQESVFDWKKNKSEIDWKDGEKEKEQSKEGGTVYKARTTVRNAETGGDAPKKSVGRPSGEYGSYKIDKTKRDSKEYKDALSAKVRAAKGEGFAARDEFKKMMHKAIMQHQLKSAGLDPADHEAAIAKKLPKSKV